MFAVEMIEIAANMRFTVKWKVSERNGAHAKHYGQLEVIVNK